MLPRRYSPVELTQLSSMSMRAMRRR